ncbi:MAG: sensor histidine kinase [Stigonema ocellatum SAG 48.90 = DSM 106950]|nr:sensor histidine kinase [Stigonema ocellatum SAG 48.90 = DSM 106950]
MNWSNWVYLGSGLALGMGFRRLFARFQQPADSFGVTPMDKKDVSILLQQIKQTQLAYQMAQEMSQFKSGFLARTTHVLRSPLNGLIGLHQLILSNLCENPDEEREFIAQAHERALKLLKLIDEILNIARTEHGTNKLNIQPQPLAEMLQEVHNLTYMLAENRNFTFRVLPPHPEIYVLADQYWLRQVLVNLVDAAISQMDEGSIYLSASLSPTSNFVHIWLDVPTHAISWSEPIDLLTNDQKNPVLLPGMKLLLHQTLLEAMGGKLEIVDSVPSFAPLAPPKTQERDPSAKLLSIFKEPESPLARLQVSIPLVIPEAGFQQ